MKKRVLSLLLAFALLCPAASAAFSDVSDAKVAQTASVLDALGIMQGVGGGRFDPNGSLTRAQFCKLAVTAMGVSDVSAYGSYTIFPDVRNSHWASAYINAAVRHPNFKEQTIIRGYADGTFGPDKTVNYGEVSTMLLRMLGYKETDIGPFWPADYIARAKSLGLTKNVEFSDPKAAVKRSDAAFMLLNTLGAKTHTGDGGSGDILLKSVTSATVENSILLATSATNSKLRDGQALFFENGDVQTRATLDTLDKSMIGVSGTVVFGKDNRSVAIGIVPNQNKVETVVVRSAAADGVKTDNGSIRPDRSTLLYTGELTTPKAYAEAWADIPVNSTLHLFYDEFGQLMLMAALPTTTTANENSFVYGLPTSANIPQGYAIVKNGVTIERSQLKKYDVITLDPSGRRALASDTRLSGLYNEGTPTFSYPQTVKMYGESFSISDRAAGTFKDIKLGDYITLLFDADGGVVAAYPKSTVSAEMQGIVTNIDGKKTTIALTNGLTVKPEVEADDLSTLMGRLVTVGQTSSKTYLTKRTLSGKESGNWTLADGKLGTASVSPSVKVYEEVLSGAPLNAVAVADLPESTVLAKDIRYTVTDTAGTITNIVLGDVTGESWVYGVGYGRSKEESFEDSTFGDITNYTHTVTINYFDSSLSGANKTSSLEYDVLSLPGGLNGAPVGIPKGYSTSTKKQVMSTLPLKLVDTIGLTAFDGANGVKTSDGYYELGEDVGVYITAQRQFISLQSAKTNYSKFRVYANDTASNGGKIRVIIAS